MYKEINGRSFKQGESFADESINVGFGTTNTLKKLKTGQSPEVRNFRKEVQNFMVNLIKKLRERSPLKYFLPLYLGLLSPSIGSTYKTLVNMFKKLLECLHESGWIFSDTAGQAAVTKLATFDIHSDRR